MRMPSEKQNCFASQYVRRNCGRIFTGTLAALFTMLLVSATRNASVAASSIGGQHVTAGSKLQYLSPVELQLSPEGRWL